MGLGLALVRAASTGSGSALHGPAFVLALAPASGLEAHRLAASDGPKARSSGLCLLMQAGDISAQNRGFSALSCAHAVTSGTRLCTVKAGGLGLFKDRWDWGCG